MSNQLRGEIYNAREVDVSGDLMRGQLLASSEVQNLLGDGSASSSGPLSAMSGTLSITGIVSSFQMSLAAAGAFFYDPSDPALTADDSAFKVVRWVLQNITIANPDGANPRIDLVVATPAMVSQDPQTRNILLDPTTRAFAPQTVNKTIVPQATISVITGTAAGTPVPPAPGSARQLVLAEIYVPASASDSTTFSVIPRVWRRAPFPWSTMSGIVSGGHLSWDLTADPTTTSSALTAPAVLRVMIQGELIDSVWSPAVFQDAGAQNPFASAAPSTNDLPYYIYAVGGRNAPQNTGLTALLRSPLAVVESTVSPLPNGQPSSAITTPRGVTTQAGAVLIGIGFVVQNTTRRRACIMTDDITHATGPIENETVTATAASTYSGPLTLKGYPAHSTKVRMTLESSPASGGSARAAALFADKGDGTGPAPGGISGFAFGALAFAPAASPATSAGFTVEVPLNTANAFGRGFWAFMAAVGDVCQFSVVGYAHGVRRISGLTL